MTVQTRDGQWLGWHRGSSLDRGDDGKRIVAQIHRFMMKEPVHRPREHGDIGVHDHNAPRRAQHAKRLIKKISDVFQVTMLERLLLRNGRCCASATASSHGILTIFKFPVPPPTSREIPGWCHLAISRYHEAYNRLRTGFCFQTASCQSGF